MWILVIKFCRRVSANVELVTAIFMRVATFWRWVATITGWVATICGRVAPICGKVATIKRRIATVCGRVAGCFTIPWSPGCSRRASDTRGWPGLPCQSPGGTTRYYYNRSREPKPREKAPRQLQNCLATLNFSILRITDP